MAAFSLAIKQGADGIELDVRLTGDGVPVVLHDAALDRTTNRSGLLRDLKLTDLSEVDAGARFTPDRGRAYPFKETGIRIPSLTEVLRAFPEVPVLLELKEVAAQEPVRQVLLEERAVDRCVLASEQHEALRLFREPPFATAASGAEIGALYRAVLFRRVPESVPYRCLSVPLRHRGLPVPTRGFVTAARRLGCAVHVWTVNEPATAQLLWGRGVAGVVTNYPKLMKRAQEK
jgi:glycerophosphoryl diester phosphodiesterase